ncbi:MAG TPA: HAD-IC family P-type ATPase, partial [Holophagaceae bacterium]|nr:HAD-IC family P-type ATPase [Holophagaceae bacterium]
MVEAPVGPGLSDAEAVARLAEDGPNLLPGSEPAGLWRMLRSVLSEPMLLLLLGAGGVYLLIGDRREALTMLSFVILIIGLSFLEERKTRRALEALRDLSSPRALVLRGGAEQRIPGGEVVRGDLLVLREGDRVPADAELRRGLLSVDESLLTGESVPLQKAAGDALYASTLVAKGLGWAEVRRTGPRTEVGRIGGALLESGSEATPLQRASRRMVRRIAALGGALALAAALLSWLWAGRGALPSVLAGLTLAMAILPQEIPVVLSVFLAMGARRLSRQQVLTRRIPTVEALGAATVLAVDKTGTLTQNRMAVAELCADGAFLPVEGATELPEAFHALVEFSILATPPDPFDPMEKALQAFGRAALRGTEHLHDGWAPERAYDLSPGLLAMTQVYRLESPDQRLLAAKGAPEAIVDLCHLDAAAAEAVGRDVEAMAARGLRVLGVARGTWRGGALPPEQHDFDFTFLGLVGLLDPPRPEVPEALATCRAAGIRVLMLTGDHPRTAEAIARRIGLPEGAALTGPEVDGLDDAALAARLRDAAFCARLKPEQKLRLVRALMASGEVVAMTGDGVNDAPALRAAHIGVAMGQRGTDVAREAADLVLVDDSFGSLVGAIREGRRIYDNLSRSVGFIFAVHVPVLGLALVPLALRWAPPLLPVHIALLEMLINPACSVVLEGEPAAPGLMDRPPRDPAATPFSGVALRGALLRGGGLLAVL